MCSTHVNTLRHVHEEDDRSITHRYQHALAAISDKALPDLIDGVADNVVSESAWLAALLAEKRIRLEKKRREERGYF